MSETSFESCLKTKIVEAIKEDAERLIDKHLKDYERELLSRMRHTVSIISLEIFKVMKMEHFGNTLSIEIKMPNNGD